MTELFLIAATETVLFVALHKHLQALIGDIKRAKLKAKLRGCL